MDSRKIETPEFLDELSRFLVIKYRRVHFDLVITCNDNAYKFALQHRQELWPGVPIVFCGVKELRPQEFAREKDFTGISENAVLDPFIAAIPAIVPGLKNLLIVEDDSPYARDMLPRLLTACRTKIPSIKLGFLNNISAEELAVRLEQVGPGTAIFYLTFGHDKNGRYINANEAQRIVSHARVPVFSTHEAMVGNGVLGSCFTDAGDHGSAAGKLAFRVLSGTPAGSIPAALGPPRRIAFDYPSLQRFNIPLAALPPGSRIVNEPFSFYRAYRLLVWVTIGTVAVLSSLVVLLVANVMQRRRAVARLAESERKFHAIFDQTFQLAGLLDIEGRLVTVNTTALRFAGCTEPEVRGHWFWETPWWRHDPAEQARVREAIAGARAGRVVRFETYHRNANGELRIVDFTIKPVHDDAGRVLFLLPEGRDITDIKRTEERLHAVLESAPLVLWAIEPAGRFTFATGSGLGLIGLKPDAIVGADAFEFHRDQPELVAGLRRALQGETVRVLAAFGPRWLEVLYAPQRNPDGNLLGAIGVALDVTDRMHAEAMRLRLATAVEQAAEEILLTDAAGIIQYANPAFERITGYSSAEAIGRTPRMVNSGRHDAAFYHNLWSTIRSGRVWTGRFENRRKDGAITLADATITPLLDKQGKVEGFVAVQRDVTRQVQTEETLRQTQRTEAIGQLAGGVAHDFNNILQIVKTSVQFARELTRDQRELDEWLEQIDQAGSRAEGLTRQLLAFSRRQSLEFREVDPAVALTDILKLIRRLIGEHIQVDLQVQPGLDRVRADVGQFEQVVLNLCVNARDAMPTGGRLTLELGNRFVAAEDLPTGPELHPGRYVVLTVRDTGQGMDEATRRRIFEPFFTTKPVGKGTGLGLSVVHGIVQQHGGFIQVQSVPAMGTAVQVYVPSLESGTDALRNDGTAAAAPPTTFVARGDETILFAEDDELVRRTMTLILERSGYRLLVATNGEEACALAAAPDTKITVAVFDVVMPRLGGIEAARRLRRQRPTLPIVLCSGYASGFSPANLPDPTWHMILKPVSAVELLRTIRVAIDTAPHT